MADTKINTKQLASRGDGKLSGKLCFRADGSSFMADDLLILPVASAFLGYADSPTLDVITSGAPAPSAFPAVAFPALGFRTGRNDCATWEINPWPREYGDDRELVVELDWTANAAGTVSWGVSFCRRPAGANLLTAAFITPLYHLAVNAGAPGEVQKTQLTFDSTGIQPGDLVTVAVVRSALAPTDTLAAKASLVGLGIWW